ncbi:hypothetical protein WA577_002697 [Blastocystis sp. JDR]
MKVVIVVLTFVLCVIIQTLGSRLGFHFHPATTFVSEPPCNDCDEIMLHDSATPSLKPTRAPTAMPMYKASLPERNEEQPPASKAPSPDVEKKTTLCIATTVIRKRSTARMVAQRNAILSLNSLPDVKAVVFTTDSFWLRYCKKNGLECSDVYETNYAGTPYFKSLIHRMEEMHSCYFYGYVNGDIVFHSNITAVLKGVISLIREKKLKERVLVTGRRTNIFDYNMRFISSNVEENDRNIERAATKGVLFREDALDYFIFTKTTYYWNQIPNLVIGRPLYDNYLLHIISKNRFTDLVDATPSILAVHQTDEDGVFAGHKRRQDVDWNRHLIGKHYKMGNTNFSDFRLFPGNQLVACEKPIVQLR